MLTNAALPRLLLSSLLLLLAGSPAVSADDWPRWRGQGDHGKSAETGLPDALGKDLNQLWRQELPGAGGATPVVWGERLFVTSAAPGEGDSEIIVLLALDTNTGKELWRRTIGWENYDAFSGEGNAAAPSPTTDGKHVWAGTGTGNLACFTVEGEPVWAIDLRDAHGPIDTFFGLAVTPWVEDGRLYHQLLDSKKQHLVALDALTGKEIWRHSRPSDAKQESRHSYASPRIHRSGERDWLLIHGADYLTAHDPSSGKEIWRHGGFHPEDGYNPMLRLVATPAVSDDLIVVPTAKNGPVYGLKPGPDGPTVAWKLDRNTPDVPSPIIHEGLVYLLREDGRLLVVDGETGDEIYYERPFGKPHRASPVLADGKLYLVAKDATISVVAVGKQYRLLSQNTLGEQTGASPVVAHGKIFVRTDEALWAFGSEGPKADG